MSASARKPSGPAARLWREVVWLLRGWREGEPPDRWNPVLVRELRRGSWRDGLAPRIVILQVFCLWAWAFGEATGFEYFWAFLPAASSLATLLLEARCAAADHRSPSWELFQATGHSHRLWWEGWKRLHSINVLSALSTLLPWAIVVNLTRTSHFEMFLAAAALSIPASCLALRRWTAFGLATTPWKRWTLMGLALLWIEPMMAGGWYGMGFVLAHLELGALIFAGAVLLPPLVLSLYAGCWIRARVSNGRLTDSQEQQASLALFLGCIFSLISVINVPTLLFFVVMAVNLSNRNQARHRSDFLVIDVVGYENERNKPSLVEDTINTFRL